MSGEQTEEKKADRKGTGPYAHARVDRQENEAPHDEEKTSELNHCPQSLPSITALNQHKRALAVLAQFHDPRPQRLLGLGGIRHSSTSFGNADLARDTDLHDLAVEPFGSGRWVAQEGRAVV